MNRATTMALLALSVALAVTIGSVHAVQFLPLIVNRRSANHLDHHKLIKEINELDWYGSTGRPTYHHDRNVHQQQQQQVAAVQPLIASQSQMDAGHLLGPVGGLATPTPRATLTMKAPSSGERDFNTRILRDFRLDLQNLNESPVACPRDIEIAAAASGYRFRCVDGKIPRAPSVEAQPPSLLPPRPFGEPTLTLRPLNNDPSRRIRSNFEMMVREFGSQPPNNLARP